MTMKISTISLREQISKRISSHQSTIDGIGRENNTEWHQRQIKILDSRIAELEWALNLIKQEEEKDV